jgi:hypothetical protein
MRHHVKEPACALVLMLMFVHLATAQGPDFPHPQQKGPFPINGLQLIEFGYTDPNPAFNGYSVPTLDQAIAEIKATGTNLVKLPLTVGNVKN